MLKLTEKRPKIEQGFVSIFSVLIIMSLLTVVAVGFSNVTRQAQIRTLDNQLNTQAFYAAEAGVNDAKNALITNPSLTKDSCQESPALSGFNYTLDSTLDVGYSCVLISSKITDIEYNSVPAGGRGSAKQTYIESDNNTPIGRFTISWDSADNTGSTPLPNTNSPYLPPVAEWGDKVGLIRFDLVPLNALDRASLANNSYTTFLYPTSDTSVSSNSVTIQNTTIDKGVTLNTRCNNASSLRCRAEVVIYNPPSSPLTATKYALRLQAFYNPVKVIISNVRNTNNDSVSLVNSQVVIDSTGRAGGVYRRIQVRLPLKTEYFNTDFVLETADSICKRLQVRTDTTTILSTGDNSVDTGACAIN